MVRSFLYQALDSRYLVSVESDVQQWLVEVKWEGTVDREEGVEEEGRSCE